MLWETLGAARDIRRINDIATILIRYGFGNMVHRLGLAGVIERAGKVLHRTQATELALLEPPVRFRHALEEMGPTFIKLGQIFSTRVDLFSPEWIIEFEKLQDQAQAVPFAAICQQLQEDFGCAPQEVFAEFNPEPLAAASIAQVHRARLHDGSAVVIKVRRPGIRPIMEADLRLLARIADLIESESTTLSRFKPREVVHQFTLSLRRELDLLAECRNAERIALNFSDHPEIIVPKVYWPWCSERVNVQEYIEGIPGRNLDAIDKANLNRKILAQHGGEAALKMILIDGFFHADPHQGNIFYLPGNRIAFIDFGMVGRLSERRRNQVVNLLYSMVEQDSASVVEVLLDWAGDSSIDTEGLLLEVEGFIDQYYKVSLKDFNLGSMLIELTTLFREHGLNLPPDLVLLIKPLITLEGVARQLDPDYNMVIQASPFLEHVMRERYAPNVLAKRSWQAVVGTVELLSGLPQDLRQFLRSARSGRFQLHVDVTRLKTFGNQLDRAASRMALGNVVASLIIGSSIVMTVDGGPTLFGFPLFGMLGFIAAFLGGIWLLVSIWSSGQE
ncbi:2-octaprenylphenol hydroxylase [Psychromonas ingrahamii 37]|uniref:2-octaprenylphenol hydroxylase n=1 Tax=Psychromonas ingrahamii (strain DSM 17664 / CCUG 51855 / 37) TaxID=357804 RepID=A1SYJ3_PSYIN|nr:AarF/UbiB family protein [Psychromonas ingrahamii]ABM04558.1 2-octaprenylphenol hydroxylase [Psychromonas ingrahamii 37]